ncbi:MAG: M50 family metallopeptidase [Candidatus Hydrothermarchaeales archaeon]
MKKRVVLAVTLLLVLVGPALAQEVPEGVNIQEELANFPFASQLAIMQAGDLTNVVLDTPLVIVGKDLDPMEQNTLDQVMDSLGVVGADIVYDDTITEFEGRSIWSYDLVLIGGPNHNEVTKWLQDEKYLEIISRDTNRPSFVIESVTGPEGKTVLVAGDVYGYEFDKKDLPTEPFIPESAAATAAVVTGIGASAAAAVATQTAASTATTAATGEAGGFVGRLKDFLRGGGEELVEEMASERDTTKKEEAEEKREKPSGLYGFTTTELGIGIFSGILFGLAYVWADTQSFSQAWVYIVAAGIAVIGHEFAHNVMAFRYNIDAKFEVWASGVGLVVLTSYLFGNVFATPGRSVLDAKDIEKKIEGLIYSTGPLVNILIAIILVPFVSASGSLGLLATVGIPINLLVAIYNLLPVSPMDGTSIKNWKLSVWVLLFVPTFAVYFWGYIL